jgi:hypothetical protein
MQTLSGYLPLQMVRNLINIDKSWKTSSIMGRAGATNSSVEKGRGERSRRKEHLGSDPYRKSDIDFSRLDGFVKSPSGMGDVLK